jgi:hypothetical protein
LTPLQLNASGKYTAIVVSAEVGAPFGADIGAAEGAILGAWQDQALVSILRQLRDGYTNRPHAFPHSLGLIRKNSHSNPVIRA